MAWDFETDPDFQQKLDWMEQFVREKVEPLGLLGIHPYDVRNPARNALVRPLQQEVQAQGLWACHLGPELGGQGYGQVKLGLMNEILGGATYAPVVFGCQAPDTGNAEILAHYGTPEQKERYLRPLLANEIVSAFSMTEPQGGSDPTGFITQAQFDGTHWVINGEKWFSTNGRWADFLIVMAVTDPDAPRHKRQSMFIVPVDTPGVEIVRNVGVFGQEDGSESYIRYTDVRLPADHLLGEQGGAFAISQVRLGGGRVHHAMRTVGNCRRLLDAMSRRAVSRKTRNGAIGDFQAVQMQIADSYIELEQFKLFVLKTAWMIDKYQDYRKVRKDIAAIKALMPKVYHNIATRCVHIHGSLGVSNEMPFVGSVIGAMVMGIADGPTEVHKVTVARQHLHAYRDVSDAMFPEYSLLARRERAQAQYGDTIAKATAAGSGGGTRMVTEASAPKLGLFTKIFYGVGSIGYGIKDVAFRSFLLLYYNQVIGIRADLVSLAILVALVVDAISDPIVGQWSDQLQTRWGRRHPMMILSAIPASLSMLFLFFPPAGMSETETFWYLVVVGCLVRTFITFFEIPSSALAPELTSDYDERTSIASFRYFFAYLGGVCMAFLTLLVFLAPTAAYPVGQLNPAGYHTFAMVGSSVMLVAILASSFGTLHRVKYFKAPPPPPKIGVLATLKDMRQTFSHRSFLALLAFGVLKYTSVGMTSALSIYFGTYLWGLNSAQLAILTVDSLVGAALGLFFAPWVSRKFGKRNAALWLSVIAVSLASLPYLLRINGLFFENGDPMLVPTIFAFATVFQMCGISSAVLVHAMIGDVVEESQIATGRRSEGLFFAANTLMQKSTSGLGVFAAGMLLTVVGLAPGADPKTLDPALPMLLAKYYVPLLIVLYIGGAGFLFSYRIDRASHAANIEELRRRDEAGEQPA